MGCSPSTFRWSPVENANAMQPFKLCHTLGSRVVRAHLHPLHRCRRAHTDQTKMSTSLGIGRPSAGKGRASHPRQPSASLYDSFEPGQLQGFKECFNVGPSEPDLDLEVAIVTCGNSDDGLTTRRQMIDQDGDGLINESDLVQMLQQLGKQAGSLLFTRARCTGIS